MSPPLPTHTLTLVLSAKKIPPSESGALPEARRENKISCHRSCFWVRLNLLKGGRYTCPWNLFWITKNAGICVNAENFGCCRDGFPKNWVFPLQKIRISSQYRHRAVGMFLCSKFDRADNVRIWHYVISANRTTSAQVPRSVVVDVSLKISYRCPIALQGQTIFLVQRNGVKPVLGSYWKYSEPSVASYIRSISVHVCMFQVHGALCIQAERKNSYSPLSIP